MRPSSVYNDNTVLISFRVDANHVGQRLDRFLKDHYRRRSRERLKETITSGMITLVRGQGPHLSVGRIKASTLLIEGDVVQIESERRAEPQVRLDYKILHEDQGFFVVDKPAPLPVHPSGSYFFNTLLTHLKTGGYTKPLAMDEDYFLVHRIDKETSGLLIVAKNSETCTNFVNQFARRTTQKTYLAIVHGRPFRKTFSVDEPIGRDKDGPIGLRMIAAKGSHLAPEDIWDAVTDFELVETRADARGRLFSLVKCFPKTGRQHQIRIHLKLAGFPIVGDKLYSLEMNDSLKFFPVVRFGHSRTAETLSLRFIPPELSEKLILDRHALHASELVCSHPTTGKDLHFRSELSADLREFWEGLRS